MGLYAHHHMGAKVSLVVQSMVSAGTYHEPLGTRRKASRIKCCVNAPGVGVVVDGDGDGDGGGEVERWACGRGGVDEVR